MPVTVERRRRLALLAGVFAVVVATGTAVAWSVASSGGEVADLMPDLAAAAPDDLSGRTGGTPAAPRFFLGFQSAAANLGTGPLIVVGRRDPGDERMGLRQQIERSDGTGRTVPLQAQLRYVYSSDHAHWHFDGFMRYELRDANGARVVRDRKTGFCLGDRYKAALALPGRPPQPRFRNRCGRGAPELLTIQTGISVGWGDDYAPHLEGQELEVTTLPAGRYVLVHRVNPSRDLRESDYADNVASMAIELSWPGGRSLPPRIDVVARCPGTATCS